MEFPSELKYHKDHAWAKIDGDTVTIGISDYAQSQLNDIVFLDLPKVGEKLEQGKRFASIESVKSVSDAIAPLSGEIIEVNDSLVDSPEKINQDCYKEAWLVKIKVTDSSEVESLLSAEDYKKEVGD